MFLQISPGDMLLALEDFGSVVRINPSRTDALLKRGKFYFTHENWHSAIADFTHMIQREPQNSLARYATPTNFQVKENL